MNSHNVKKSWGRGNHPIFQSNLAGWILYLRRCVVQAIPLKITMTSKFRNYTTSKNNANLAGEILL